MACLQIFIGGHASAMLVTRPPGYGVTDMQISMAANTKLYTSNTCAKRWQVTAFCPLFYSVYCILYSKHICFQRVVYAFWTMCTRVQGMYSVYSIQRVTNNLQRYLLVSKSGSRAWGAHVIVLIEARHSIIYLDWSKFFTLRSLLSSVPTRFYGKWTRPRLKSIWKNLNTSQN